MTWYEEKNKIHISFVTCHMSLVTCHLSLVTCHLSLVTCHLSHVTFQALQYTPGVSRNPKIYDMICNKNIVTCYMSLVTCHLSIVSCQLSLVTCHLSLVTCHLSLEKHLSIPLGLKKFKNIWQDMRIKQILSHVTCYLSHVTCHLSRVSCKALEYTPGVSRNPKIYDMIWRRRKFHTSIVTCHM